MASTHKHLRSGTADKRPTTSIAEGQIALNTNATSPGLFFKDSTGATIIKIGPVHVGTTAPNAIPAAGGSSGNSTGEVWLDTSLTPVGVKIWNGTAWVNATPSGSTTVQGLLELATNAETQAGSDTARAVTPASLQSKVSDSVSTTSSTTIASSTAVKAAYDLAAAAVPAAGGIVTGNLEIGTTGSLTFEGSTADGFETTLGVVNPTADRSILLPNVSGTVVTTGDTGSVTSAMIADGTIVSGDIASGTIVDANISATAEIAVSKLANGSARQLLQTDSTGNNVEWTSNVDIPGTLDVTSTATFDSIASIPAGSAAAPTLTFTGDDNTGIYSPGADQVAISTNGSGRLFVTSAGLIGIGQASPGSALDVAGEIRIYPTSGTANLRFGSGGAEKGKVAIDSSSNYTVETAGSERLRITSAGLVGIGTSAPSQLLHVSANSNATTTVGLFENASTGSNVYQQIQLKGGTNTVTLGLNGSGGTGGAYLGSDQAKDFTFYTGAANLTFQTNSNPRMTITSAGSVGIGTTSPTAPLAFGTSVDTTPSSVSKIHLYNDGISTIYGFGVSANQLNYRTGLATDAHVWHAGTTERARIDGSGRLLVGTSTARNNFVGGTYSSLFQVERSGDASRRLCASFTYGNSDAGAPFISFAKHRGGDIGNQTVVQSGDSLGSVLFHGSDGTNFIVGAGISAEVDGTPGANDMPGRIVLSTTASGASFPTERLRIDSSGRLLVGTSSNSGGALLQVNGDRIRVGSAKTPASATDTGTAGEICWDANYVYVCTATNTWKRSALSTW